MATALITLVEDLGLILSTLMTAHNELNSCTRGPDTSTGTCIHTVHIHTCWYSHTYFLKQNVLELIVMEDTRPMRIVRNYWTMFVFQVKILIIFSYQMETMILYSHVIHPFGLYSIKFPTFVSLVTNWKLRNESKCIGCINIIFIS